MSGQSPSPIPPQARVAAGLTLASYVIAHPTLCWQWLRDPFVAQRSKLIGYALTLIGLSALAGLFRAITFGVYVPLYGAWRMPLLDALEYYLVTVAWVLLMIHLGTLTLKFLGKAYEAHPVDDAVWMGLVAFSSTPFLLSGLLVMVPSEILRSILSLVILYSFFLFWNGISVLQIVRPERRVAFFLQSTLSIVLIGYLSLLLLNGLLLPSYPARLLSEPVLSRDALEFKVNLEQLISDS